MPTVMQEFYCNNCDGYFRPRLNMELNRSVVVVCPNCGHEHHRVVKNGVITDVFSGAHHTKYDEQILCPKSAYSKEALHKKSRPHMRDGEVVRDPKNDLLLESWRERYGHLVEG